MRMSRSILIALALVILAQLSILSTVSAVDRDWKVVMWRQEAGDWVKMRVTVYRADQLPILHPVPYPGQPAGKYRIVLRQQRGDAWVLKSKGIVPASAQPAYVRVPQRSFPIRYRTRILPDGGITLPVLPPIVFPW